MLLLIAFVAGFAVMSGEMAAGRLVAPYFGSSTPVWGAIITFVLAAMALGAELGGRAADRWKRIDPMLFALGGASWGLAALPFAGRALLARAQVALGAGDVLIAALSLTALAILAAPPVIVLGGVGPWLVRTGLADAGEHTGRHTGRLSAASTFGSIAGTLVTIAVGLPLLGTTRTVALSALLLAMVVAIALRSKRAVLVPALPAIALVLAPFASAARPDAVRTLESPYALLQVVPGAEGTKRLVFDDAFAVQSVHPPRPATEVWSHYRLTPLMTDREGAVRAPRVLLLGLGAGTAARSVLDDRPEASVVGVELDPGVVKIAREDFDLPKSVEVHVGDARAFLAGDARSYDVIVVDAFRFPYAPFHLTTAEFAKELHAHLAPGGVVCVNIGRWREERGVEEGLVATLSSAFPFVFTADAHNASNTLAFAADHDVAMRLAMRTNDAVPDERAFASRVSGELVRRHPAGAPWTDDRAPVELATDLIGIRAVVRGRGHP